MLFRDYMDSTTITALKTYMIWNNYGLNDIVLTVQDDIKNHALDLLKKNYGSFEVDPVEIEPAIECDVSINFPLLLQSLSISSSMTYQSVSRNDRETEDRTISETGTLDSTNEMTMGTNVQTNDNRGGDGFNNTITTNVSESSSNVAETSASNESTSVDGNNTSSTPATGSRSVSLSHAMPEQAIDEVTHNFNKDGQGTPELNASTVQGAEEGFSTINKIENLSTIEQTTSGVTSVENSNSTTNIDNSTVTVENTYAEASHVLLNVANSGKNTEVVENTQTRSTTDSVVRELANKQYPMEIDSFLKSIDSVKSFSKWLDAFYWICGVQ